MSPLNELKVEAAGTRARRPLRAEASSGPGRTGLRLLYARCDRHTLVPAATGEQSRQLARFALYAGVAATSGSAEGMGGRPRRA